MSATITITLDRIAEVTSTFRFEERAAMVQEMIELTRDDLHWFEAYAEDEWGNVAQDCIEPAPDTEFQNECIRKANGYLLAADECRRELEDLYIESRFLDDLWHRCQDIHYPGWDDGLFWPDLDDEEV